MPFHSSLTPAQTKVASSIMERKGFESWIGVAQTAPQPTMSRAFRWWENGTVHLMRVWQSGFIKCHLSSEGL